MILNCMLCATMFFCAFVTWPGFIELLVSILVLSAFNASYKSCRLELQIVYEDRLGQTTTIVGMGAKN